MALHLVTGYKGNAHITSADQGVFNAGCVGSDEYVFTIGRRFEAQVVTSNAVRIFDGSLSMQGRHVNLDSGTFLDVIIASGLQSMNRNDLIVLRYTKDVVTGIESVALDVIQGTLTDGTAVDPVYTKGDILAGATLHEMPLYRVRMSGVNITSVEPMFKTVVPLADIQKGQNLLVNGDFSFNQRESKSYDATDSVMYSVDMWRIHKIKLDVLEDGVKVTGTSTTENGYLTQFINVDKIADKYTVSAMVDDNICTFTTALSNVAAEKEFGKFKITILCIVYPEINVSYIKFNICPIKTASITIKYVDLFEGDTSIEHVKEDPTVGLARCQRFVRYINNDYPIVYSYPGDSSDKRSYVFKISHNGMWGNPSLKGQWSYRNTLGDLIKGTIDDFDGNNNDVTLMHGSRDYSQIRTPNRAIKHDDCYAISVEALGSCELLPSGDNF